MLLKLSDVELARFWTVGTLLESSLWLSSLFVSLFVVDSLERSGEIRAKIIGTSSRLTSNGCLDFS